MNNETYTFEDRMYVNPSTSYDEQMGFIENLRAAQQAGMEKIASDTHNLGTDVTSNLGGLNGAESLWKGQYVTPKVNNMVSSLRTAAQAQLLQDALNNYQSQLKQRYNQAYRAAAKRAASSGGGSGTTGTGSAGDDGVVNFETVGAAGTLDFVGTKKGKNYDNSVTSDRGGAGTTTQNRRTYYVIGNNSRVPITVSGSGSSVLIDTPTQSYTGKGAANSYVSGVLGNGKKIVQVGTDGKMTDVSNGVKTLWGL